MTNNKDGLTAKQKKFVRELIKNQNNATKAAIAAGYSEKTATSKASQLLTKVNILQYRDKLLSEVESDDIADIEELMKFFTRGMRREEKESVVNVIKEKQTGWAVNKQTGKREKVTIEKETPVITEIKTRVSDANKSAEMLGKIYGVFTDKLNIDSNQSITFVEDLEDE